MAHGTREEVVGELSVVARLALGIERLRLVLTDRRLIVAHSGKKGAGSLAFAPLLGQLALKGLEEGPRKPVGKLSSVPPSPTGLLSADKDNFQIDYQEIVRVELSRSSGETRIVILTGDDKFQFTTSMEPGSVERLLREAMGDRVNRSSIH